MSKKSVVASRIALCFLAFTVPLAVPSSIASSDFLQMHNRASIRSALLGFKATIVFGSDEISAEHVESVVQTASTTINKIPDQILTDDIITGSLTIPPPDMSAIVQEEPNPMIEKVGFAAEQDVRFVVRSYEMAGIGSQLNAQITYLPQREGDSFKKGDILIQFDCKQLKAERNAASASLSAYQENYKNQKQMLQYKTIGALAVKQSYYQLEKAKAELEGVNARAASCIIRAPFDGRVTQKSAQVYEIAQPNQLLIKIANEDKLELVLMVPSKWLSKMKKNEKLMATFDETGEQHEAIIVQSTGVIDPVSQSARVLAELVNKTPNILPGMSGTLKISYPAMAE